MSWKLLTYKQDFGDEFDVLAQAVMTEEEYLEYRNRPSGVINPHYEDEIKEFNTKIKAYEDFVDIMKANNLYTLSAHTPEQRKFIKSIEVPYIGPWEAPNKILRSYIYGFLGNYGDDFEEPFMDYTTMGEVIDEFCKVFDVTDEFARIFTECRLSNQSMCNIFEIDE